jgi:hypothetical protein
MMQCLEDAREELKRVDHQIWVSLKYTRTVDVLLNIISRMIDGYAFLLEALIKAAVQDAKADHMPPSPIERGNLLKQIYAEDEQIRDNIELFFLLRKLFRSNPQRENEYRRNVTMRTVVEGREELVTIDIITNYYHFIMEFYKRVEGIIKEHDTES